MDKKILLSVVLLITFIFSINYVFATDNLMQDATNTLTNSVNKTENTMQNAGNAAKDVGNGIMNATNSVIDGTAGAINNLTKDRNTNTTPNDDPNIGMANNTAYTATRTTTAGTLMGMSATTWTWIIMGLVAIAIVGLVWYYSTQTTDKGYDD